MKETQHISSLYQKLYNGSPWIDITITAVLENIPAEQAAGKLYPMPIPYGKSPIISSHGAIMYCSAFMEM
jgi:hypothetical protein